MTKFCAECGEQVPEVHAFVTLGTGETLQWGCSECLDRAVRRSRGEKVDELDRYERVYDFHVVSDTPVAGEPAVPSDDRVRLRMKLIAEEFFELLHAVSLNHEAVGDLESSVEELIAESELGVHLPGVADALADLDYVIEGMRLEFGIFGEPIEALVHEANMAKFRNGVHRREDGKILKPHGWKPPDIDGELRRQGWKP